MLSKRLFLTVAVAAMCAACGKDETPMQYIPDENEIVLNILHPNQTRVSETSFDVDDKIGVYVTHVDAELQLAGNEVTNYPFIYNGSVWTSQRSVYWNEGRHNIYAYYPYSSNINDIGDYEFSVQIDQSTPEAYAASDFLWASVADVEATGEPVKMQFAHTLSRVVVKLVKGETFEGDLPNNMDVYIYSTVPNAVIDLSSGGVAKKAQEKIQTIKCKQMSNDTYSAIVVPQKLSSRTPLVEIVADGVSYMMDGKISYKPGYSHTLTVTLSKSPENIKIDIGGEIIDWN
ncbi:MAG: fimbrillin family protein [Alistipes sp.]|nr:fimbrillin family protein [Alistipes sp.]